MWFLNSFLDRPTCTDLGQSQFKLSCCKQTVQWLSVANALCILPMFYLILYRADTRPGTDQSRRIAMTSRTVVKSSRFSHIIPVIKSPHWLKIKERIEYKLLSLIYTVLTTSQTTYLPKLATVQSPRSTRSSSVATISRPPTSSSLKITNRSFQHAAPRLWNKLPHSFREPHPHSGLSPFTTLHRSDPHCHLHLSRHQ